MDPEGAGGSGGGIIASAHRGGRLSLITSCLVITAAMAMGMGIKGMILMAGSLDEEMHFGFASPWNP